MRAWGVFGELGLRGVTNDIKVLTLKGRLFKDLAWRTVGEERARLFRDATDAYLAAHALKADSYPLINAAALALFAGEGDRASELARQVLDLIDSNPDEGETPFWREATRAEAHLLLGEQAKAEAALAAGVGKLPEAWEDHARTLEQFAAIIDAQGGDLAWLDRFRPAPSLHFSGLIGLDPDAPGLREEIDAAITSLKPGFGFGALAAGADIMIAEAAVALGARLVVTLPNPIEDFRARSIEPYGADWGKRFDVLIERAERVEHVPPGTGEEDNPFALSIDTASLVSMGQAIRNADILSSHAHALTIVAPGEAERLHVGHWRMSGRPLHRIESTRAFGGGSQTDGSEGSALDICLSAIVCFDGLSAADADVLADRNDLTPQGIGARTGFVGKPKECLAAMESAAKQHGAITGALSIDVFPHQKPGPMIVDRTDRLLQAAERGQFLTDYQSAMIARVLAADIHIEELGELASLSGPISLWSINP